MFKFFDNNYFKQIIKIQYHLYFIKYLLRINQRQLIKVKINLIRMYKIIIIKQKNLNLKLKIQIIISQFAIFKQVQPIFKDLYIIQQENKYLPNFQYLMYFKLFSVIKNLIMIIKHQIILMKLKYNILFYLRLKIFLFYNSYNLIFI